MSDLERITNAISKENNKGKLEIIESYVKDLIPVFTPMLFVRYPFFVSTSTKKRRKELSYIDERVDGSKVKWQIDSKDYLPGEMEYKVWCWILYNLSDIPKPLTKNFYIPYSLYKIAKFWNLDTSGKTLNLIKKAIKNLRTTDIYVWLQAKGEYPIDFSFTMFGERGGRGKEINDEIMDKNVLFLSSTLLVLINRKLIKPLNGKVLKELIDKNIISARLYELLGWRYYTSHKSKRVKFLYDDLVSKIGLDKKRYLSQAKRQLENAHKHLININIIKENPKWNRLKDTWCLTYSIGETLRIETSEFSKSIEYGNTEKQLKTSKPHSKLDDAMNLILDVIEVEGSSKNTFSYLVNEILNIYPDGLSVIYKAVSTFKQEARLNKVKSPNGYLYAILKKSIKHL